MSAETVPDLGNIVGLAAKRSLAKLVVGILLVIILGGAGFALNEVPGALV